MTRAIRLPYVEQGDPDGTPVVFLHGFTDSWRSWEQVLPLLPDSIRAIAVTQRGHGDAARPTSGYGLVDYAVDVATLIAELDLGRVVLVGHSMGAWVAERVAIDHPHRVLGTVLVGAIGPGAQNEVIVGLAEECAALTDPIDPAYAREFQLSTTERPLAPELLDTFVGESLKVPGRVWKETAARFLDIDLTAELGAVSSPALLVYGDCDAFVPSDEQQRLSAAIPRSHRLVYEGIGHAVHWDDPERFAEHLAEFVGAQGRSLTMSASDTSGRSKRALTA
jgi:pimeloyl-ACP methyl ester carboxylesterase